MKAKPDPAHRSGPHISNNATTKAPATQPSNQFGESIPPELHVQAWAIARAYANAVVRSGTVLACDLDDLQQEGLVAAYKALSRFDPVRGAVEPYLRRVVANRITSAVRTAKRRPATCSFEDEGPANLVANGASLHLQIDVSRAVATLGPKQRHFVAQVMHDTPVGVCRTLGISRSTFYDRLRRLREAFAKCGLGPQYLARHGCAT